MLKEKNIILCSVDSIAYNPPLVSILDSKCLMHPQSLISICLRGGIARMAVIAPVQWNVSNLTGERQLHQNKTSFMQNKSIAITYSGLLLLNIYLDISISDKADPAGFLP